MLARIHGLQPPGGVPQPAWLPGLHRHCHPAPRRHPGAPTVEDSGFGRFGGFGMEDAGPAVGPYPSPWGRTR